MSTTSKCVLQDVVFILIFTIIVDHVVLRIFHRVLLVMC